MTGMTGRTGRAEASGGEAIVAERRALADTLVAAGPDAPTLAGAWTAADLAAHVVSLDRLGGVPTFVGRTVVSRRAIRLNDVAGRFADAGLGPARRRGFDWAVERLRAGPPRVLLRPSVAAVGLFEVFVHHEDVRRATGAAEPRNAPVGLEAAVPWLLRYQRTRLPGVRLRVRVAGQEHSIGDGSDVLLEGDPAEVVLWLAGRRGAADVRLTGEEHAVDRVRAMAVAI